MLARPQFFELTSFGLYEKSSVAICWNWLGNKKVEQEFLV